jgi:hypothetical protein
MGAGAVGQLSDPFVDSDADGVARLFADRLSQRRLDREPVRAVALGHQRARERLAVDRAADLHEPAGTEELGHVIHEHARPRTGVVALLKLGFELSQHDSSDSRTRRDSSPSGLLKSLSLSSGGEYLDAVGEEPRLRGEKGAALRPADGVGSRVLNEATGRAAPDRVV